jgi:hypothetical protein
MIGKVDFHRGHANIYVGPYYQGGVSISRDPGGRLREAHVPPVSPLSLPGDPSLRPLRQPDRYSSLPEFQTIPFKGGSMVVTCDGAEQNGKVSIRNADGREQASINLAPGHDGSVVIHQSGDADVLIERDTDGGFRESRPTA